MINEIKAVAYYRMSSDKQEQSIADQRTAVAEYATENGYKIIREYLDEGISGSKEEERKQFMQLIADATDRGDFRAVLCWDQDRFSRFDPMDANYFWRILRKAGVHIATVAQGRLDFEDFGEWIKASVVQHGKNEFLRDLARNTARGMKRRKSEGYWVGGVAFGYVLEDGRLALGDPSDVALVRRIFDLRVEGHGVTDIAKQLNSAGIPSPRGKQWSTPTISEILSRKTYVGDGTIGEHSCGRYEKIATEVTTQRDTLPAIIDRETWDAVQGIPTGKRRASGSNGSDGVLSGLLRCGRCGAPMYAKTNKGWNGYLCSSYTHGGKCGHCSIRRDPIMRAVAAKLREHVLMGSVERLEAAIQRELDRQRAPSVDPKATAKQLAKLDRKIERAAGRILSVDDALVPDVQKQLRKLKEQRDQLAATVGPQSAKRLPSAKAIAARRWELDRILAEAPPTVVRHSLAHEIDHIRLDFQETVTAHGKRRYEFTGGVMHLVPLRKTSARSF